MRKGEKEKAGHHTWALLGLGGVVGLGDAIGSGEEYDQSSTV